MAYKMKCKAQINKMVKFCSGYHFVALYFSISKNPPILAGSNNISLSLRCVKMLCCKSVSFVLFCEILYPRLPSRPASANVYTFVVGGADILFLSLSCAATLTLRPCSRRHRPAPIPSSSSSSCFAFEFHRTQF